MNEWDDEEDFFWVDFDEVGSRFSSYEGKPVPDDQVASRGRKSIGNAGNGFGSVQCGSKSGRMLHRILGIE